MNKTLAILGLLIVGIAIFGFIGTVRAEWPFEFNDSNDSRPPDETTTTTDTWTQTTSNTWTQTTTNTWTETTTTTSSRTWTYTPVEDYTVSGSVRLIGDDGQVLTENRIFSVVWGFKEQRAYYFEIPFLIDLMHPEDEEKVAVGEADADVTLWVYIWHENLTDVFVNQMVDILANAINGSPDIESDLNYFYWPYGDEHALVVGFNMSKHVVVQWGGTFYLVLDTFFDDAYKVLGDGAYGEWQFKFALSIVVHGVKDIPKKSAWVGPITLEAKPLITSTTTTPPPGGGKPPGGKPPWLPLSVVWRP